MEAHRQLEIEFAEWQGLDPDRMVACSSGTAALHLAFESLRLKRGGNVLMGEFNMVACPRAVTMAGMVPRGADVGDDLLFNPHREVFTTKALVTDWMKDCAALLATHIYGRKCNVEAYQDLATGYSTTLGKDRILCVEDLAEAHGVRPHQDTNAACWSFYRNKIVHGEEGGAVYFRELDHARLARQLRSLGFTDAHDFWHVPRGHNYRMSNVHAELVLKSLREADASIERRRQVEQWYDELIPEEFRMPRRDVVWVYDIRVPGWTSVRQGETVARLNERGIAARHAFKPVSSQVEYHRPGWEKLNAARLSREVIYLPVSPAMTRTDVESIVSQFLEILER